MKTLGLTPTFHKSRKFAHESARIITNECSSSHGFVSIRADSWAEKPIIWYPHFQWAFESGIISILQLHNLLMFMILENMSAIDEYGYLRL